jgi:shikimate kinase
VGLVAVVVILYGPKAAGKSQVAKALSALHGVVAVDADEIVLNLVSGGARPDPSNGWLLPVEQAVMAAMRDNPAVSVEATGAWDTDWQLALDLQAAGARILRVWVCAPLQVTLDRLASRTASGKVPSTLEEARTIYRNARARARNQRFDLTLDTGALRQEDLTAAVAPLSSLLAG